MYLAIRGIQGNTLTEQFMAVISIVVKTKGGG